MPSSSRPEASGSSSQPPSTSPSFNTRQLPTTSTSPFQQQQHLPSSSNTPPPAGMSSAQTRSSRPDGNSSSRGASPDYRTKQQYEPARRSRLSVEEERSGAGTLLGLQSGGSSSRNASSESLSSNGGAGFAGRGAGHSFASSVGLPPINTHLQPQQQQQNSANMQSPASASNGSHGSSRLSMRAHPRPISTQGLPPPSSSLPHSPGFGAPRSPLAPPPSHSPREPHFPPSKSNSGSSTNSLSSSAQRSPTHPPQTSNSNHPAPQPPSRPTSTSGHSSSSHGGHSHGHGGHELEERDRSAHRDARERERERDRERRREGLSEGSRGSMCAKCGLPMTGQFVRALGTVYHLDCFRCQDCSKVVANKFFPVEAPDGSGKQLPLCETDYFRRLGLLCSKCGAALRGSYITALDMKFHVEHFTCSVCPTVFGPQDSYYEHGGSVYCHFHYSTRFAVKCTGCRTAILKQFVEINRNSQDEHWHPECYMIHKFWNIKLAPSPPVKAAIEPSDSLAPVPTSSSLTSVATDTTSPLVENGPNSTGPPSRALEAAEYLAQEEAETPVSLKNRQKLMEEQVYRIWTVLSAFEESSAACISEMLRHVSSGHYIEGVRMAEKFVLHVETLFSAIDDLSVQFKQAGTREISHVREARMLCKKVVNFFSLLSHTHETGARKMSITQELLSLVTGLAHYLKILIRIALTAALKLEREFQNLAAIGHFLSKLDRLARDPEASKFSAATAGGKGAGAITNGESSSSKSRTYGYKSLTRAVGSTLVGQGEATTDLCEGCHLTVEEECARFGTSLRWHLACLKCWTCGKVASKDPPLPGGEEKPQTGDGLEEESGAWLKEFRIEPAGGIGEEAGKAIGLARWKGGSTYCSSCAGERGREGFEYVTRLEQYAFLLCVALNKLYALLKQRGVVPSSPVEDDSALDNSDSRSLYDTYRDSTDIKRMKSVNLDRKLSSTTARIPKRSMVVQSPSGRTAQPNDTTIPLFSGKPPVPSRKDQPIVDPIRGTTIPASTVRPPMPNLPASQRSLPPEATFTPPPPRPSFNRATTAIEIVDEPLPHLSAASAEGPGLGGNSEPTQDEEGITLADIPVALEAEQAREQHRHSLLPRSGTLLSELSALEYLIVRHVAALLLSSENSGLRDVVALDELLEIIDARKGTFWNKLFKGNKKEKVDKKKGVFGIPLEVLVERNGADSMHGAGPGSLRVPSFVDDVISAMKQMDMSVEGIFRKNGNIRRLKDLCEALDRDSASVNLSDDNPVQLAALLKKFLRDLPDPLLPYKLFSLFISTQRIENLDERKKVLHLCCCLLPKSHRDTMEAIFVFLKWVASFSHVDEETGSKMDLLNLSTVVSPNILYSKGKDPAKDESFSAARAVHELLEYQDEFWQVPAECVSILNDQELFSNPTQLTSKEILARAENHVRFANRRAGSGPAPIPHRGEVQPQRPDFNQAYSAPALFTPGSGPPSRPGSTNPLAPRTLNERPISFSTQAGAYSATGVPLRHAAQPPRSPVGSPPGRGMTSSPGPYRQHYPVGDGYHPPPPRSEGR